MRLLRLSILFAFFAFSFARAACADFEIFANQTSLGCAAVVSTDIISGNYLTLSISPTSGDIKWKATTDIVIGTGYQYTPILKDSVEKTMKYIVERNGVSKEINVNFHPIYSIKYNLNGGTISTSPPTSYNIKSQTITLPTLREQCGYRFDGWFDNPTFLGTAITTIPTGSTGNKVFYANWKKAPSTPTINMIYYTKPETRNKTYDGNPIMAITAYSTSSCSMGAITVLYNDSKTEPKNAGIYKVYASIAANENYAAEKILLGDLTISKAKATFNISATIENKEYDGTTTATIKSVTLTPASALYGTDKIAASDYSAIANFDEPNVGEHNVVLKLTWLNGPLSKNYDISVGTIAAMSAIITKATTTMLKIAVKDYDIFDPKPPEITIIEKSSFISENDIRFEYKMEGEENYVSMKKPNKVGNWSVKAIIDENANYKGQTAEASFVVTKGNAIKIAGFELDQKLSGEQRQYYVTNTCEIQNTKIQIAVEGPDIVLKIKNIPQTNSDEDGWFYEIDKNFGKPGLDTLIYELISRDGLKSEFYTILMETPIPFDTIVGQKWNNVLFVNNNKGYKFVDFEWFKNNKPEPVSYLQYYSAGPSSKDVLNPNDVYKVTMHTKDGIRISTCEGNAKIVSNPVQPPKPTLTKQVLGIREKSLKSSSKVYNLNGKLTKETPAGVYIVEE